MSENKALDIMKAFEKDIRTEESDSSNINQNLKGNGNVQVAGNNNTVNVETKKVVTKTTVVSNPGKEHITDEQAFKLGELVREIVETEKKLKKDPNSFKAVWTALNRAMKVRSYLLIPLPKYRKAELYLHQWLGRLNNMKSAPKKNPGWRKRQYSYIYTNVKQLNFKEELETYIKDKFDVDSLKDLNDEDLKKIYNKVASWKRSKK